MRRLLLAVALIFIAAGSVAVEVPFRDGSVLEVVSYKVTGSFIMLETADGAQLAYDVGDIDLDELRRAEAAAAEARQTEAPANGQPTTLGVDRSMRLPAADGDTAAGGLTITDQHVRHVDGSGISGPEDDEGDGESGAEEGLEGYEQGGNVLLNNVTVNPMGNGEWQVRGEVVNRTANPVLDVRANLEGSMPTADGAEPWTASVGVSGILGPDEKATFTHSLVAPESAPEGWSPQVQVNVVWMREEPRLEPNYNRTAPHPSALPLDRGGVGGADVREEIED
jgi:hypothetical protein